MKTARKELFVLLCLLITRGIYAQQSGASKDADVGLPQETTVRYSEECTSTAASEVETEIPNLHIEDLQPATVETTTADCSDKCELENREKCLCDCKTGRTLEALKCENNQHEASGAVPETVEQTTRSSTDVGEELEETTTSPILAPGKNPADDVQKEPSFICEQAGTFANTLSNNSYHWCVVDLSGSFQQYFVTCRAGEVYFPQLGKCFIDYNNLENLPDGFQQTQFLPDQEDIIENEIKMLKQEEKKRMKLEKQKKKLEEKMLKEAAKKAKKEAKEQAKLVMSSKESESFLCTQEGNFASTASQNRYFSCISKKGKFKVVTMYCPAGQGFDPLTGACALIQTAKNIEDDYGEGD